ncbi:hypothetical protein [Halobacterium yunchengense]|uniref:hypothetical protein n=1 Tax=Halobacterium yunchengense TaxID=3108497 RepID=UPI00300847EA
MSGLDADAAREYVRTERGDVLDAVDACADAVAGRWASDSTADAAAVADPLEDCLAAAGVLDALPGVLVGAVDAAGGELRASPVPAPPYVAVTSRGPVLRATLEDGRLVVTLAAFRVTDDGRYERDATDVTVGVR